MTRSLCYPNTKCVPLLAQEDHGEIQCICCSSIPCKCAASGSASVPQEAAPQSVNTESALNALPPMIIGPMIKKMREEQQQKKQPTIQGDEAFGQAPGIRVGGSAWKWPPFLPTEDLPTPSDPNQSLESMAGMMKGAPQLPNNEDISSKIWRGRRYLQKVWNLPDMLVSVCTKC